MEVDEFEYLVTRSLELGVPHEIVAELFELPVPTALELQKMVRVKRYGTADMPDFIEGLQWRALEQADKMLRTNPDQAARIVTAVFGRQIQAAGRRPSSEMEEARARVMDMFAEMRDGGAPGVPVPAGRFVLGRVDVDRRAHRDEEDDDA